MHPFTSPLRHSWPLAASHCPRSHTRTTMPSHLARRTLQSLKVDYDDARRGARDRRIAQLEATHGGRGRAL